jgi:hypothetical protein
LHCPTMRRGDGWCGTHRSIPLQLHWGDFFLSFVLFVWQL